MGPLLISLMVTPAFAEVGVAPSLRVRIDTEASEPVALEVPSDDACFIAKFLKVNVVDPRRKPLAPVACTTSHDAKRVEVSRATPYVRTLELKKLIPAADWGAGQWTVSLDWQWNPQDGGPTISQVSHSGEDVVRAKPLNVVTLKVKDRVTLPDGATFTFRSHGHKRTYEGDPSPLIIRGEFGATGGKPREVSLNLQTEETRVFEFDGHFFELLDWEYDVSMKLKYFGRVKTSQP